MHNTAVALWNGLNESEVLFHVIAKAKLDLMTDTNMDTNNAFDMSIVEWWKHWTKCQSVTVSQKFNNRERCKIKTKK